MSLFPQSVTRKYAQRYQTSVAIPKTLVRPAASSGQEWNCPLHTAVTVSQVHFHLTNIAQIGSWRFVRFVFKVTNTCNIFWVPRCFTLTHGVEFMHAEIVSMARSVNSAYTDETRCCFIWTEIWAGKGSRNKGCWSATGAPRNPGNRGFCSVTGVFGGKRLGPVYPSQACALLRGDFSVLF